MTIRDAIAAGLRKANDPGPVVGVAYKGDGLDYDFTGAWTAWTDIRVYFPATYDGTYWVASVPRHPSEEAVEPVGDG